MIASSLASARDSIPVRRPSDTTMIRSASSSSSGSSELTITIASPSPASVRTSVVDLLLGADVDAAGRLVEQEHPRPGRQPLADDHLLLVAAGERRRDLLDAGAAHPEATHRLGWPSRASPRAERMPKRASRASDGSVTLSRIDASQMQPLGLAVLGDERDAEPPRVPRRARPRPARPRSGRRRRAVRRWRRTASRGSRCGPSPSRPAMPSTSPARTSKLDAVEHPAPAAPRSAPRARARAPRAPARPPARSAGARRRRRSAPDHRRDHPVAVHLGDRRGHHVPAVAQHRDPVGQREDLVDPVRDVDDPDAVRGELPHDPEQPRALRRASAPRSARP